jgi:hypothetical protein
MSKVANLRLQPPCSRGAHMALPVIARRLGVPRLDRQTCRDGTLNTWTDFLIRTSLARMLIPS